MKRYLIFIMLVISFLSQGTHLKGGYIRIEQISSSSLEYRITLNIFTSPNRMIGGVQSFIDFGDGTVHNLPEQISSSLDDNTNIVVFSIDHTYTEHGAYVVSFSEPNRNAGVINLDGSIATPFYIESFFIADGSTSEFASPQLLTTPILTAPLHSEFTYGISAVDRQGNTLIYQSRTPATEAGSQVSAYNLPENFKVNPFNGLVSWDTMFGNGYVTGEYLFNVRIFQFKDDILRGYMDLEFTVILQDQPENLLLTHNQPLDNKNRIFIEEGTLKTFRVFFEGNQSSTLELEPHTDLDPLHLTFYSYDSSFNSNPIKAGTIIVRNETEMIRDHPYILTIRGTSVSSHNFKKDVTFMIFSKDTDITEIPEIPDIEEEENPHFKLYPNPFKNTLYIEWPSQRFFDITFYNIAGQIVFQGQATSGTKIRLNFLSQGIYLYKITDGKLNERGRLIKK